ncbi:mitochondrial inner membrane protein OXA1L [Megalops cyprinoides]|uniref:mitochondrial inner membrane protein OXA1L n=1 Tax=Megalops cyprinoides TaxID=118141 RepID=UPI00186448FD|nr:mitochondrial inner membrane protein OXA1L [Megalops cyprinoides]
MTALLSRTIWCSLSRSFLRNSHRSGIDAHHLTKKQSQWLPQQSLLHTIGGVRAHLSGSRVGRHHHGRLLLVSAVSVRNGSSQISVEMVSTPDPAQDTPAPHFDSGLGIVPDHTSALSQPITEQVAEAAPTALDVLQGVGPELSLSELGLGSYTPVGLVQNVLEFMHVDVGLPWWGAIVAGTVLARCAVLPVIVKGQREAAKLNNVLPEITKITHRLNEAKRSGNQLEFAKASSDMMLFQKEHDVNPLRGFLVPLVQLPVFISFFIALRNMSCLPVPSMQSGGLWWFPDLTVADPFYILPLAVTGTMFAVLELGAESGVNNPNMQMMKTVLRIMPFVVFPITINFPTAVFTYWLTSNVFSLGQVALLRHPAVRQRLNIPERVTHPPAASPDAVTPPPEGFIKSFKTAWKNAQLAGQLEERNKRVKDHLDIAARGPVSPTFSHSPLQQKTLPSVTDKPANPESPVAPVSRKKSWEETIG